MIELAPFGEGVNSVAVHKGLVAAAVEAKPKQAPGKVVFFDAAGQHLADVTVGALPDMVTFTPDGRTVLVANEGEPSDDYETDPEGSVSLIDVSGGVAHLAQRHVRTVDFAAITRASLPNSVRIFGPRATPAQDLEPEYIAVSADSRWAYVTLQENNGLAIIDVRAARLLAVKGLGFKDHRTHALDASNKDKATNIRTWPVWGMYQPDALALFTARGRHYLVTANEGDARDYDGFSEEARVADLRLDTQAFPNAAELQRPENLGRLKTTTALGDTDGDGDQDRIYAYGARSFSIWSTDAKLVYDSGDELERRTAAALPKDFNSTNDENGSFDDRSDDKGPEPEGLVVGEVGGAPYLFLGLERVGGVIVYDLSNPDAPVFVDYVTTRVFDGDPKADTAGDLAPEGLVFVSARESPNGKPLLIVSHEVSGSVAIFEVVSQP